MKVYEIQYIIRCYVIWFVGLISILLFAVNVIPLQENFLGGGKVAYSLNPFFWVWSNFDGEHYLSIARLGYGFGQYPFFPLYPMLVEFFGKLLGNSVRSFNAAGIIISHVSLITGLIGLYKLIRLDYSIKIARLAILFTLLFPTSFYFISVYTESLFLTLAVWSIYFARKQKWLFASFLGIALTATRFVGLVIVPVLIIEWLIVYRQKHFKFSEFPQVLLAVPTGLLAYMYYLEKEAHDMFAFFNNLALFGEQRSTHLVILPQVFFRYLYKILPNLNTVFLPIIFTTFFEFAIGVFYLFLAVFSFFRLRLSYAFLLAAGYIIPTFSGSFSSLPRYVSILFPSYILFAIYANSSRKRLFAFAGISFILLFVSFILFSRGYWLS